MGTFSAFHSKNKNLLNTHAECRIGVGGGARRGNAPISAPKVRRGLSFDSVSFSRFDRSKGITGMMMAAGLFVVILVLRVLILNPFCLVQRLLRGDLV